MATSVQVVFDCADPTRLSEFWAATLGYKLQDPPGGAASWEEWLTAQGIPESEWNSASAIVDPDGKGPRIFFQRVPEPKTVKNRVH
ncbi:MAG TPA: VOC family protein, partial [Herpetosiphonaceae bacterium]|nr:VOC family protein [Herpetosiphonaceae bacterium]